MGERRRAEFGGEIEFPYRKYTGAPMMKRNPVQSEDDAWKLRVPDDIATVGTIPVALEFSRLQYGLGMPCTVQVGSRSPGRARSAARNG